MVENKRVRTSSDLIFRVHSSFEQGDEALEVLAFLRNSSEEVFHEQQQQQQQQHLLQQRVTSEELFNSWINNSSSDPQGRGISLQLVPPQRNEVIGDALPHISNASKPPRNVNGYQAAAAAAAGMPFQKPSWFQQNYPMTRSRSSELRRRYLALEQAKANASPISAVVSMLKGTLERKNLNAALVDEHQMICLDEEDLQVLKTGAQFNSLSASESSAGGSASEGLQNLEVEQTGCDQTSGIHRKKQALEDSTKKRRVERKRMMTEAKERSQLAMTPSELQAAMKRCEALEKEVRSLKMNLSFMNRKDSEQTKAIELLERQNEKLLRGHEKLLREKEELHEEVKRSSQQQQAAGTHGMTVTH